jgi:hypothetical protein
MSQENVEMALLGVDAFIRRDVEALIALMAPGMRFLSRVRRDHGGAGSRSRRLASVLRGPERLPPHMRNRKCIEARTWLSHADALETAGLRD